MKTKIVTILLLAAIAVTAQNPVLHWKFDNANVGYNGTDYVLEFDVMASCDMAGICHIELAVYFRYNALAFGNNICSSGNIEVEKGELIQGETGGVPWYIVIGPNDSPNSKVALFIEYETNSNGGHMMPNLPEYGRVFHIEVPIQDETQLAGIEFVGEEGGVGLMNGSAYYIDMTHPTATKYGDPPDFACVYENDLLGFPLLTGTLSGIVSMALGGSPIENAVVYAGGFSTYTNNNGAYELILSEG
ncbi:MAG: hypothetical protein K8R53_00405, partial [Bacteroidales bacterium]|nr:hypothetical protein [Bacteroidales bacterium]